MPELRIIYGPDLLLQIPEPQIPDLRITDPSQILDPRSQTLAIRPQPRTLDSKLVCVHMNCVHMRCYACAETGRPPRGARRDHTGHDHDTEHHPNGDTCWDVHMHLDADW